MGLCDNGWMPPAAFLLKTEPSTYSFEDLERAGAKGATWDGVANATALIHLRTIKKGDLLLIYHTGDEKRVVGLAECTKSAYPDPKQANEKLAVIDLKAKSRLKSPVTLAALKSDPAFKDWDLIRLSRLSVVPTPEPLLKKILQLADS